MRRKIKATILLIIGFYSSIVNTTIILIIPFHYPMIPGPPEIIDPGTYWRVWWSIQGWQYFLSIALGLFLIIIGYRYLVIKEQHQMQMKLYKLP
ncbi:hypothetical protein LCGC14_0860900 [marine sediment metagenome]|uniref:Uncharacterized protein n=1 Tax=marine sediment metagenome TaxID=412755 RepID=A0A0F9RS47_9ZZZZ|nr:hypothetical protein [bacterium]